MSWPRAAWHSRESTEKSCPPPHASMAEGRGGVGTQAYGRRQGPQGGLVRARHYGVRPPTAGELAATRDLAGCGGAHRCRTREPTTRAGRAAARQA
jgi:hypothetical protein